jgi:cytochrome P450
VYFSFSGSLRHRLRQCGAEWSQADGRLTAEEVCSQCILLLGAGHITTMDQLGNTVLALLKDPEPMGRLRDDPGPVRSATEEGLRYGGSAQPLQRIAREDLRSRGGLRGEDV